MVGQQCHRTSHADRHWLCFPDYGSVFGYADFYFAFEQSAFQDDFDRERHQLSSLVMTGISVPAIVTFEFTQDGVGLHSFAWPANVLGGIGLADPANAVTSQSFLWDGTTAYALSPKLIQNQTYAGSFLGNTEPTGTNNGTYATTAYVQQANNLPPSVLVPGVNGQCVITLGGVSVWGTCQPLTGSSGTPGSPTYAAGAGTGPSGSFVSGSTDAFGGFTLTTGSSPTLGAEVLAIPFSKTYSKSFCVVSWQPSGAGQIGGFGNTTVIAFFNNTTALAAGTGYSLCLYWHCDLTN